MKKKILIGSIIAVALLTLVSFSSVVGYNSVKDTQEEIIKDEYEGYTPIALVLQLISKLHNHKDIENVETENDVLQIIEGDAELNIIVEKLKSFGCGCEDETESQIDNETICKILGILSIIPFLRVLLTGSYGIFGLILDYFWFIFECYKYYVLV